MYTTLHNALTTWPKDPSRSKNGKATTSQILYDRVTFGEDDNPPSASSIFKVTGANYPKGKVFVPPFFVPPGSTRRSDSSHSQTETPRDVLQREAVSCEHQSETLERNDNIDPALQGVRPRLAKQSPLPLSSTQRFSQTRQQLAHESRSPSPSLNSTHLQRQRAINWSDAARQAFHVMINAPGYVNRYRLTPAKYRKLLICLRNPDVEPLNEDGSKDHQTKYQAAKWILRDGKLYRKAERKGSFTAGIRRHLGVDEVWDVLTAEHVRTDHLGRDRLRKVLERRYIGYTLQEIMFVLRECRSCNGRAKIPMGMQEDEHRNIEDSDAVCENEDGEHSSSADQQSTSGGLRARQEKRQTSNFMWF